MQLEGAALQRLTAVLVSGPDARKFMQGHLTHDIVKALQPGQALLASSNTGQGRVQMVTTVLAWGDDLLLLCPSEVVEANLDRFKRFILRAKVGFEPLCWGLAALSESAARGALGAAPPQHPGAFVPTESGALLRYWGDAPRYLWLGPAPIEHVLLNPARSADAEWHAADVHLGLPQVYPETLTAFVPQNLNLDRMDAIRFDKGCYVGQEVVARARLKGVRQRMFGFSAPCPPPTPGCVVMHDDSEAGTVVDAAATGTGCELLAVVSPDLATGPGLRLLDPTQSPLQPRALPYD